MLKSLAGGEGLLIMLASEEHGTTRKMLNYNQGNQPVTKGRSICYNKRTDPLLHIRLYRMNGKFLQTMARICQRSSVLLADDEQVVYRLVH